MKLSNEFPNWLKYGQYLANFAEYKRAKRAFDRHLEDNPYDYDALYGAGWAMYMAEKYDKALPYLKAAVQLNPLGEATEYYDCVCGQLGIDPDELGVDRGER